jgi:hypothetical protein
MPHADMLTGGHRHRGSRRPVNKSHRYWGPVVTLTIEAVDQLLRDYCRRHGIDRSARRHPQIVRLRMIRHLVAEGRADEIPTSALEGELPPLTADQRYKRAGEPRRDWARSTSAEAPSSCAWGASAAARARAGR